MRVMTEQVHQGSRRWGVWALGFLAGLVVLVLLAEGLSAVWTDFLWFHWTGVGEVWTSVAWTKAGLAAVFVVAAFLLSWVSLYLVDKVAPRAALLGPETELVRRYHAAIGTHAALVRTVVSVLLGLALGAGTASEWRRWLLFEHAVPFGRTDPLFHLDDSFFVFRLPFLSFLVGWILLALLVVFAVSVVAHFFNGAIRLQGHPRLEPRAIAHLSLLLGAMALVRAWGYYYVDRYRLDMSGNGVVGGASYTDVHVRLPADTLLAVVALAAFVLLVVNAYQRSLTLPLIAVGLWGALALVIGVIYPAAVQAFQVNPAQSSLEKPYIQDNINATHYAMGIGHVTARRFPANTDLTPQVLAEYRASLEDSQVWDPSFTKSTFDNYQQLSPSFALTPLQVDRYRVGGRLTPVVVTVRRLAPGGSGSHSWVNLHLQYTHGSGAVVAPSTVASPDGMPQFDLGKLPPRTSAGLPRLSQPAVYFAPGNSGYVIADTTQPEVDYQTASGKTVASHYHGSGGVPLSSWLTRAAYALRLKDFNLLISNDITAKSRLLYVTDVRARVQKALPFLTVDSQPYPVIDHGQLNWVVDAYTTSSSFPYGEPAFTGGLPSGSPLAGSYDYIRDAVKVVVNAYTGKMHFYAIDAAGDPIMRAYERAFPGLFQPLSAMDPTLQRHLRYPQQLLMVQATMYGLYHVSTASQLYANSAAWDVAQTSTSVDGSPTAPDGVTASGDVARYQPIYELLQLPGSRQPSFQAVEPLVPYSPDGRELKTLSAVLFAGSTPHDYGDLEALVTGRPGVAGPALANADILHSSVVSDKITALSQSGSQVTLGTLQILPVADSLLYVRPLYVSGGTSNVPQLVDVIVLYGKDIAVEPTLSAALKDVFGTAAGVSGPGVKGAKASVPPSTSPFAGLTPQIRRLLGEASASYAAAQKALAAEHLGAYQRDLAAEAKDLAKAQALLTPKAHKKPAASKAAASKTATAGAVKATRTHGTTTSVRRAVTAASARTSAAGPAVASGTTAPPSRVPTASRVNGRKVGAVEAPVAAVEGMPTGTPGTTG